MFSYQESHYFLSTIARVKATFLLSEKLGEIRVNSRLPSFNLIKLIQHNQLDLVAIV